MKPMRQPFYPKHQVLVLKCYPNIKFLKNTAEVKPNSSELSYLLYYASTRRSKLRKVGDFLESKVAADLWRTRTGNVQVTLQIFSALIEKCPRDLPLFAPAVLRALRTVLRSMDVTLLECSVSTFETFCAHHGSANLAAEQDYFSLYEEVVRLYAAFASKDEPLKTKHPISVPVSLRFRKAGLQAIKSIASSESLASDTERILSYIIPVILENILSEDGAHLRTLRKRDTLNEVLEKESGFRRRQSMSTVRTADTVEADPMAASSSIEDADKLAEEEIATVAMQCLRHIFTATNRGQLQKASSLVLRSVETRLKPEEDLPRAGQSVSSKGHWSLSLFETICEWAAVQDRFIILITAVETLVRNPVPENNLQKQLVLARIVDWLLCSNINFIGLSVMDVLVGLIQQLQQLLQMGDAGSNGATSTSIRPTELPGNGIDSRVGPGQEKPAVGSDGILIAEAVENPLDIRTLLVDQVKKCIGDLANHVYYTDQISDMVFTVLHRLRPAAHSGAQGGTIAIGAIEALLSSTSLEGASTPDKHLAQDTFRLTALLTVKDILTKANNRTLMGNSVSVGRNKVGILAWEGTEWLLRDPNGAVRRAYCDAFLTWLKLEVKIEDMLITSDHPFRTKSKKEANDPQKGKGLARRAVSGATQRDSSPKRTESPFLQLLHLAIYEDVIQHAESVPDIILFHLLLVKIVERLGINGVRPGLPMIMRLQKDIQTVESPTAKVNIGSLVHGYFWALAVTFEFEPSSIGREIHGEITRRKEKGMWLNGISVPPLPLEQLNSLTAPAPLPDLPSQVVQTEVLKPFDSRQQLVDIIAVAYESRSLPTTSPPRSPNRSMSISVINQTMALSSPPKPMLRLPSKVKQELLSDWSKEACIAAFTKESSRSISLNGSRAATGSASRNLLTVNIPAAAMSDSFIADGTGSPMRTYSPVQRGRPKSAAPGNAGGRSNSIASHGHTSALGSPSRFSSSSRRSVVRVEDLKRVLSGGAMSYALRSARHEPHQDPDDTASESMVSANLSASEASFPNGAFSSHANGDAEPDRGEEAVTPRPSSRKTETDAVPNIARELELDRPHTAKTETQDDIPPVPPLPAVLQVVPATPGDDEPEPAPITATVFTSPEHSGGTPALRKAISFKRSQNTASGAGEAQTDGPDRVARADFQQLLDAIDVDEEEGTDTGILGHKPPY